jgi:hypothetical protein
MKEVQSLCTFGIGALCFAVFVIVFKPDAIGAVSAPGRPEHCKTEASPAHGCRPRVFAAASGGIVWPRQ